MRPIFFAVAITAVVSVSACAPNASDSVIRPGGTDGSTASAQPALPEVSNADVTFAQGMLPHHVQGVQLATLALTNVTDPDVRALAQRIIESQSAEQKFLQTWLSSVSPEMLTGHEHAMAGMLTPTQLSNFSTLAGEAARSEFLSLMTAHHQGAIDMANARLREAGSGTITTLARSVIAEQTAEIARMAELSK